MNCTFNNLIIQSWNQIELELNAFDIFFSSLFSCHIVSYVFVYIIFLFNIPFTYNEKKKWMKTARNKFNILLQISWSFIQRHDPTNENRYFNFTNVSSFRVRQFRLFEYTKDKLWDEIEAFWRYFRNNGWIHDFNKLWVIWVVVTCSRFQLSFFFLHSNCSRRNDYGQARNRFLFRMWQSEMIVRNLPRKGFGSFSRPVSINHQFIIV